MQCSPQLVLNHLGVSLVWQPLILACMNWTHSEANRHREVDVGTQIGRRSSVCARREGGVTFDSCA